MTFYVDDDDDAQVDGEGPSAVAFQARGAGQPWLMGALPPWHMWGGQETLTLPAPTFGNPTSLGQQIARVAFKRPETFHWLFFARIVSADAAGLAEVGQLVLRFDLTVGLGRTSVTIPAFDRFVFSWGPSAGFPTLPIWATQTTGPERFAAAVPPSSTRDSVVTEIVAQDIQLNVRADNGSNFANAITFDVAAFFAPKNHIRPDWFADGPPELQFGGGETQGK